MRYILLSFIVNHSGTLLSIIAQDYHGIRAPRVHHVSLVGSRNLRNRIMDEFDYFDFFYNLGDILQVSLDVSPVLAGAGITVYFLARYLLVPIRYVGYFDPNGY